MKDWRITEVTDMEIITLTRSAVCKGCGKNLPVGTRVRYYAEDKIYCEYHKKEASAPVAPKPQAPTHDLNTLIIEAIDTLQCLLADLKENIRRLQ